MPGDTQTIDQKFISLENLTQYDENIKDWVDDKVVELTYAQYSALDPSVQNNGTTYLITDRVSGTLGQISYNDLADKPNLATVATSGSYNDLSNKPTLSTVAGTGSYTDLTNKPTLGSAAALDVAATGDASTTEVVKGDDTRLTDARTPVAHTHTVSNITDFPASMPASDVYSWAKASTKPSYTASEVGAVATTAKGAANGVAELDANGLVPSAQLPSYVDDVIEGYYNTTDHKFYKESTYTTEITGTTGKIYVDLSTDKTYRWSGSAFVVISETLAIGTTSSTAFRGDYGDSLYTNFGGKTVVTSVDSSSNIPTSSAVNTALAAKANGEGLTFFVDNDGILNVTY